MPEPPLGPQPIDRRGKELAAQVEGAYDQRRRTEEPRSVCVERHLRRFPSQTGQNARGVTRRVCVGMNCEHARVLGIGVSQPTRGLDQELPRLRSGVDPPRA